MNSLNNPKINRRRELGPVHAMLTRAFPRHYREDQHGIAFLDVTALAKELDCSYQSIYVTFKRGRISAALARKVINLANQDYQHGRRLTPIAEKDVWAFVA